VQNLKVGWYLAAKGAEVLKQIGAQDVGAADKAANLGG